MVKISFQITEEMTVSRLMPQQNPLEQLQAKFKEVENGFRAWLAKQSSPVEAAPAVVTTTRPSVVHGASIGALMAISTNLSLSLQTPQASLNPYAIVSLKQAQALSGDPFVTARYLVVLMGLDAGISCVVKRLRGKDDVQSRMVAAFGAGAIFPFVLSVGFPYQADAVIAVSCGLLHAVLSGGNFQFKKMCSQLLTEDVNYSRTRSMLNSLGLQNYEKNFKRGLLTDSTLPLLTDSALRDVKIPTGPRLLILDHIQRDPESKQKEGRHGCCCIYQVGSL